jgi:hypothetical protein
MLYIMVNLYRSLLSQSVEYFSMAILTSWLRVPHSCLVEQLLKGSFYGSLWDLPFRSNLLVRESIKD